MVQTASDDTKAEIESYYANSALFTNADYVLDWAFDSMIPINDGALEANVAYANYCSPVSDDGAGLENLSPLSAAKTSGDTQVRANELTQIYNADEFIQAVVDLKNEEVNQ
jgi:hypothetical protein